jgi:hypothetical protein
MTMTQPYETGRQAAGAARHIYDSPPGSWGDGNLRLLKDACRTARSRASSSPTIGESGKHLHLHFGGMNARTGQDGPVTWPAALNDDLRFP